MNTLLLNIFFNLFFPFLLIGILLFIKSWLNRFFPFSKVSFLYYMFTCSCAFSLFLLLTKIPINPFTRKMGSAVFTFLLIILIIKLLNIWFKESYIPRHRELRIPFLLIDIIRWLFVIGFLFFILRIYFNVNLTGIFATSAVATAIIGFALQDILKNFFSGITLNLEIPFKRGDWISIGKKTGEVVGMTWRATKIRTVDGNYIIIPNANISTENIINYSARQRTLARYVRVGVHYRFAPKLVKDIIKKATLSTEGVLKIPEPIVRLIEFKDFSIDYQCKFWLRDYPNLFDIEDRVRSKIWYFFKENDIEIPFPITNIYTHKGLETKRKESGNIISLLERIEIFSPLTKRELTKLSQEFTLGYFAKGERIIKEGEAGTSFFIIKQGRISVNVQVGQKSKRIKYLENGAFIGEMSLLTGEKRTATIIAEEETEVLILDRKNFAEILKKKPSIAAAMSKILAQRKLELVEKTKMEKPKKIQVEKAEERSILEKIKKIFGLEKKK